MWRTCVENPQQAACTASLFSHASSSYDMSCCGPCPAFPSLGNTGKLAFVSAHRTIAQAASRSHSSSCISKTSSETNVMFQRRAPVELHKSCVSYVPAPVACNRVPGSNTREDSRNLELKPDSHERATVRNANLREATMFQPANCNVCGKLASCMSHAKECQLCGWKIPKLGALLFRPNGMIHRVVTCGCCGASAVGCSDPVKLCDCGLTARELFLATRCEHVKNEVSFGCQPARRGECNRKNCSFCHCALAESSKSSGRMGRKKPQAGERQKLLAAR
eukprot:TRINITY_DN63289_c0_g1_i1.p1 TRINITY_DN63289_c0_g1~~TRINITY_DN63289_c0_g1_i1.p1  ORF type:complete len:278 (+),score=24.67 TRINITY_DN63289_c0_g1_i1:310-1143(+)